MIWVVCFDTSKVACYKMIKVGPECLIIHLRQAYVLGGGGAKTCLFHVTHTLHTFTTHCVESLCIKVA